MMDLKIEWDDAEIHSLCKDIIDPLKNSSNSLITLRQRCGKRECGCKNYTPHQSLSLFLKLEHREPLIDRSFGLSLINNYSVIGHEEQCQAALERLTMCSLSDSSLVSRDSFLDQVWNCHGIKNFTIDVVEELFQFHISRVEEEMLTVYEKSLKNTASSEIVWEDNQFEKYVFWSSKSAKIFTSVSSLLNSCLLRVTGATDQYELCILVTKQFVDKVRTKCDEKKQDFVLLYPYDYHSLVLLLDIPPEFYPETPENRGSIGLESVVKIVKQNLKTKPGQTICLLTHFPKWVPYIRQ